MMKNLVKLCLMFCCIFGFEKIQATEMHPFFLLRQDGTALEGYFLPSSTPSSPIVFAIQGSFCESAHSWHADLCEQMSSLGLGLIVLEKQGISRDTVNLLEYNQTNCLQNRLEDYVLCLKNVHLISPGWDGKIVFWGESEGGMLAAALAGQTPQTAAVLLFGAGGGMSPREEVKWTIRYRLEAQGASQNEIEQYMIFLDEQMDATIFDPSPDIPNSVSNLEFGPRQSAGDRRS